MVDMVKVGVSKEKILSTLRSRGPSLPVQIAREIEFSPLFASAFLSELKAEGKIQLSNMRVGSSPLYFLPGQEKHLEKFVPYLNQREKEAFELLRKKQVLVDSEQTPVMRVALRAIKDFAIPFGVKVGDEQKLHWKYFTLTEEDVGKVLKEGLEEKVEVKKEQPVSEVEAEEESEETENKIDEAVKNNNLVEEERPLAERKKAKVQDSEFAINVKDYLQTKEIEILHVIAEKKKELEAKIRINTDLGRQTYYLLARDKKSVSDNDLILAEKKGRAEKLPAVFMSFGELNKKGRAHLEQWGNLVKFEKLNV